MFDSDIVFEKPLEPIPLSEILTWITAHGAAEGTTDAQCRQRTSCSRFSQTAPVDISGSELSDGCQEAFRSPHGLVMPIGSD
ncbi:MAG TPA: hypothetical protein EYQ81_09570 [Sneathiellales bacterium]|nr:hypothetical protein [Sneathiellales bacterium]